MDNFDDFESKSYTPAEHKEFNQFQTFFRFAFVVLKTAALTIFELCVRSIWKMFNPVSPKNIAGQTALVTGLRL
jgi:hypothetical protein